MTISITRLFDKATDARQALDDLVQSGVPEDDISIIANQDDVADLGGTPAEPVEKAGTGASIGGLIGGAGGFLCGLGIIAVPGMGPLVAAGWIATTAAGVVAGAAAGAAAGGLVGALTEAGMSRETAEGFLSGVKRGSTLITVRVDDTHGEEVRAILDMHHSTADIDQAAQSAALATIGLSPDARPLVDSSLIDSPQQDRSRAG